VRSCVQHVDLFVENIVNRYHNIWTEGLRSREPVAVVEENWISADLTPTIPLESPPSLLFSFEGGPQMSNGNYPSSFLSSLKDFTFCMVGTAIGIAVVTLK
jgi:hypothetical protein